MLIEERIKKVVIQITDNASLTDHINDQEARHLLAWGNNIAQGLALLTVDMDEAAAEEFLYPKLKNLRRVMRRTSKLLGNLPAASEEEITSKLYAIFEAAAQVPGIKQMQPGDLTGMAQIISQQDSMDALTHILTYL